MVDQLTYRLNRVPDRNYLKFLELIGVRLFPPSAAQAPVTFWLSSPQDHLVVVPRGARVQTQRVDREEPVVFETLSELTIYSSSVERVVSLGLEDFAVFDHTDRLGLEDFDAFGATPAAGRDSPYRDHRGDPRECRRAEVPCPCRGGRCRPREPPAHLGGLRRDELVSCELERDETGGLNQPGDIILHVPPEQEIAILDGRSRRLAALSGAAAGGGSALLLGLAAHRTINASSSAAPPRRCTPRSSTRRSSGSPRGWRASTSSCARPRRLLRTAAPPRGGWWRGLGGVERGRHLRGEWQRRPPLLLGPCQRRDPARPRGAPRGWHGAQLRARAGQRRAASVRQYRSGGGQRGNVSRGALSTMKTQIPFIARRGEPPTRERRGGG